MTVPPVHDVAERAPASPQTCSYASCRHVVEQRVTTPDGFSRCYCEIHTLEVTQQNLYLLRTSDNAITIVRCDP